MSMEELIDIYDENRQFTGVTVPRKTKLEKGRYMLYALALLENQEGRILITKRALTKKWAPGSWEIPGGGAHAGEDSTMAVCREAFEETGIRVVPENVKVLYSYRNDDKGGDNYFNDIFLCRADFTLADVTIQNEEVIDVRLATVEEIHDLHAADGFLHYERIMKALENRAETGAKAQLRGRNPIITSVYTADPAPMVYGDTLYLYTTHDEDDLINDFYTMFDWRCYSTKDMVNWTDHGVIFSLEDIDWADDRAWAPQAVERNGKFYLYSPVHKKNGGMAISVAISDSPTGPFRDLGYPLVDEGDWNDIDPTVFIDNDGQAYLYFGNPELRYVLLNEDMVSYNEEIGIVKIPMTVEAFGKGSHMTGTTYGEGPWFYRRKNLYYMVFAGFAEGEKRNEHLAYSTSASPTGPWVYGGVLMEEGPCFTNHPGIADFKGHSYLFYHTDELPGGSLFHRSVCVAEFKYNEDGTIDTIAKCDGVDGI